MMRFTVAVDSVYSAEVTDMTAHNSVADTSPYATFDESNTASPLYLLDDTGISHAPKKPQTGFRIRSYQADLWDDKFEELKVFRERFEHCLVPHNWCENIPLAQWVKRQRYQFKLKQRGGHSTMTDERQQALEDMGFVWDSHRATWEERLHELRDFQKELGHCNVPSMHPENPKLSVWVKCQRRQFRLFRRGEKSNMTGERIEMLSALGFVWNPRNLDVGAPSIADDDASCM